MEFGAGCGTSLTLVYRETDAGRRVSEVRLCKDMLFHPQFMGKMIKLLSVYMLSTNLRSWGDFVISYVLFSHLPEGDNSFFK